MFPAQPPGLAFPRESVGRKVGGRREGTSTCPGPPAAIAGKKCVPVSPAGFTRYGVRALPGISPPPPSQVLPPLFDQTTYMSYSHEKSFCTVPAADSTEHVAGLALRLMANPK